MNNKSYKFFLVLAIISVSLPRARIWCVGGVERPDVVCFDGHHVKWPVAKNDTCYDISFYLFFETNMNKDSENHNCLGQ